MLKKAQRDYATQSDYADWVRHSSQTRQAEISEALRQAFAGFIHREEAEFIVFTGLTVHELAGKVLAHPLILKPLLLASNIAARAIERDLGIRNLDTYDCRLSKEDAVAISGYVKPFLPDSMPLLALTELDRVMFVDKEIRKQKGQWETRVVEALNCHAKLGFKKTKFRHNDQYFELDAAAMIGNRIAYGIDIKRVEARRDIHKRSDEIINKANHLKSVYPKAKFGVVFYYPFIDEQTNVQSRLDSPFIDAVFFAGSSPESVNSAVKLLLGKLGCLKR